jgi:hypothetical protein
MDWMRSWIPSTFHAEWVIAAICVGLGLLILTGILRSAVYIHHYGFWNWLKASFRIEGETWRLIAILLFVAAMAMMAVMPWG